MSKHRPLYHGNCVPQSFFDALQEFISTNASNFRLELVPGTTNRVQVYATPGNGQVGIGINGLWRYNVATVQATVSGPVGTYDLFVTTSNNNFFVNTLPPPPETDGTNYAFALVSVQAGTTPTGVDQFRKVGEAEFDGTHVTLLRNLIGGAGVDPTQLCPPGMIQPFAGPTPPDGWLLCDGSAVSRDTYWRLFRALGGDDSPWGTGDGGTTFNVPDLRGRTLVGAFAGTISGLTARGLGIRGGVETVKLSAAQSGVNANAATSEVDTTHTHNVQGSTASGGGDHTHTFSGSGNTGSASAETAAHTHTYSGTSATANANHNHGAAGPLGGFVTVDGSLMVAQAYPTSVSPGHTPIMFANVVSRQGTTADSGAAHTHTYSGTTSQAGGSTGSHTHTFSVSGTTGSGGGSHTHNLSLSTQSAGAPHSHNLATRDADDAHENMPPFAAVNYCVKV